MLKRLSSRFTFHARSRARFVREAEILARLRHPNIVAAYGLEIFGDDLAIVMEHVPGETLSRHFKAWSARGKMLDAATVRAIFLQLCSAIAKAHENGFVHRDVKPGNVIVHAGDATHVKVLDFGVARLLEVDAAESTTVGRRIGSYQYMSPEQARGEAVDERCDIFALGCILFELVTLKSAWGRTEDGGWLPLHRPNPSAGENALPRLMARVASESRPRPSHFRADLGTALDDVVRGALAANVAARFARVEELIVAFSEALPALPDHDRTELVATEPDADVGSAAALRLPFDFEMVEETGLKPSDPDELGDTVSAVVTQPTSPDVVRVQTVRRSRGPLVAALLIAVGALALAVTQWPRTTPPDVSESTEPTVEVRPAARAVRPPAPQPVEAREAEEPDVEVPKPRRRARRRARAPVEPPEPPPVPPDLIRVRALFAAVERDPHDGAAMGRLLQAIREASATVPPAGRTRIERKAYSASLAGDVEGMRQSVRLLGRALQVAPDRDGP